MELQTKDTPAPAAMAVSVTGLMDPSEAFFPRMPPLNIELSSRCNLKCPYCANPALKREYENMPDDLFQKVVREAKEMGVLIEAVHGVGEPLLRHDLEALCKVLDATGVWSKCVATNGTLLSLARMKSLHEAGVRAIYNSLDTLDPDLYRRTRSGKLEKVIDNVVAAAAAYSDVAFYVGLMNHKEQTVDAMIRARFEEIYGHLSNVTMHVYENGRFPGAAEDWRRRGPGAFPPAEVCFAPASNLTIDARGEAALCCADQNSEHSLGNARDKTLREIWFDRENQETFRHIALGLAGCPAVCYKCVLKPSKRKLGETEPVLWGPYARLIEASHAKREAGDIYEAKRYMDFALLRDPRNDNLRPELTELETLTGIDAENYWQKFRDGGM